MNHTRAHSVTFTFERRFALGAGIALLAITLLYTYFVAFSIAHVARREALVRETGQIAEEVAALETEYLARSADMTAQSAFAFGLVPIERRVFVEKRILTFRTGE